MAISIESIAILLVLGAYLIIAEPVDLTTLTIGSNLTNDTTTHVKNGVSDNTTTFYMYSTNSTPTLLMFTINETMGNRSMDVIQNTAIQLTFCMLYTSIFILGVFGNVLVCYVVINNKAMQTVTNLFITNLALSDILLCVLAVPFTPLYTFLGGWVFGTPMCHIVPYAQGCSVYISTLTLTSIAIDRFFVIIYPFHPRMKLSTCISIIVTIWVFSLLVTLPYGMYVQMARHSEGVMVCEEYWPTEHLRKVYSLLTTSLQFLIPFVIIAICYICVSVRLNNRAKAKPGSKTSKRDEADRERKKRTNRMLICMVAIFGLSWFPLNIVNVINDFYSDTNDWRFYNLLFFLAHLTAMSSTCYNPFLYAWLNENFRKEFKQVLPCFDPSHGRNGNSTTNRQWRSGRTCNGNTETIQETLLPSSALHNVQEIQPRGAIKETGMRASPPSQQSPGQLVDTILLSDIKPQTMSQEVTIILPSGVIETKFDNISLTPSTQILEEVVNNNNKQPPSAMKKPNTVKNQNKKLTIDDSRFNNNPTHLEAAKLEFLLGNGGSSNMLGTNNNNFFSHDHNHQATDDFNEANGSNKINSPLPVTADMISLINTDSMMMLKKQH
jgi:neuropeptide F receptor